jgi:hypothetical protein
MRGDRNGWRWLVLALACVCATSVHAQPIPDDRWGWNYCPPPYPPACVGTAGPAESAACAKELKTYIATVAAYRACQVREVERAIAEANDVSAAFRCRTEKRDCQLYKGVD